MICGFFETDSFLKILISLFLYGKLKTFPSDYLVTFIFFELTDKFLSSNKLN
jgi:hypothetical protein